MLQSRLRPLISRRDQEKDGMMMSNHMISRDQEKDWMTMSNHMISRDQEQDLTKGLIACKVLP